MPEMMPSNLSQQEIDRLVQEAVTALQKGDLKGARSVAEKGRTAGVEHAFLLKVEALWLHDQGRYQDALRTFHHARTLTPGDPSILNGIAGCLAGMGEKDAALKIIDESLKLMPDASPTHYLRGWILDMASDSRAAQQSYERAIALSPKHVQALAGLASVALQLGDFAAARSRATQALALDPSQPTAIIALAKVEIEQGDAPAAESRIRRLLETNQSHQVCTFAWGVLGDALDAQDRKKEAFAAWQEKAEVLRRRHAAPIAEAPKAADVLAPIATHLESMPADIWRGGEARGVDKGMPRTHVFVLGFLRSGTTLLEQVLAAHSDVVSLEERGSLKTLAAEFMASPSGLDRLATLGRAEVDETRAAYWQQVRELGIEPDGRVVVDKDPLNTINLPLIARLFPEAKVLFAVRDPRDVVFSCYRHSIEIVSSKYEFLTLEGCANFYAAVMNMANICRAKLPLVLQEHRYEDMVENFEGRMRAVCEFLGIAWTEDMLNFSEKSRTQAIRATLSANQVRRPLYREGIGAWRRYAEQLAPAMPVLMPWVRMFGYTER